ncbi:MAG: hypothetical protein RL536_579 [Candidatus Parcubacteria bacterium]
MTVHRHDLEGPHLPRPWGGQANLARRSVLPLCDPDFTVPEHWIKEAFRRFVRSDFRRGHLVNRDIPVRPSQVPDVA